MNIVSEQLLKVAQAEILLEEYQQGYSNHKYLAIGYLYDAARELLSISPELAMQLRLVRMQITGGAYPNLQNIYKEWSPSEYIPGPAILKRTGCYDCCEKHLSYAYWLSLNYINNVRLCRMIAELYEAGMEVDELDNDLAVAVFKESAVLAKGGKGDILMLLEKLTISKGGS